MFYFSAQPPPALFMLDEARWFIYTLLPIFLPVITANWFHGSRFLFHEINKAGTIFVSFHFPFLSFLASCVRLGKCTANQTTRRQSQTSTEIFFWSKSFVNTNPIRKTNRGLWESGAQRSGKLRGKLVALFWFLISTLRDDFEPARVRAASQLACDAWA